MSCDGAPRSGRRRPPTAWPRGLAIFQQQQGARWPALQAGGPGRGQHLDIAGPRDGVQQRKLDHPVLDDVAKSPLTQAGGIEIDVAETVLLPHLHLP
jgi:hypothetical protein